MLAFLIGMALANAVPQHLNDEPELALRLTETVVRVCVPVAKGTVALESARDAGRLKLRAVATPPAFLRLAFPKMPQWYLVQGGGESIFVSRTGAGRCQVILANTPRTVRVQGTLALTLRATGFSPIVGKGPRPDPGYVDQLWAKPGGGDYLIVWVQAPRETMQHGEGDQGSVTVAAMPKAQFDALAQGR
jgi:hypothetical protein